MLTMENASSGRIGPTHGLSEKQKYLSLWLDILL